MQDTITDGCLLGTLLLVIVLCSMPIDVGAVVSLDDVESAWIKDHRTLTVGILDEGWPPFVVYENGRADGLSYAYLRMLADSLRVGLETRVFRDVDALMQAACAGEVDVIPNLAITAERTRCVVYTRPYVTAPFVVVGRSADPRLRVVDGLNRLRIVVERGYAIGDLLRENYPNATQVTAEDTEDALRRLAQGEADAYVGSPYVVSHLLNKLGHHELSIVRVSILPITTLHFAVPNPKQPLVGALDKALAEIPQKSKNIILEQWLGTSGLWRMPSDELLTAEEQEWVSALPVLRLGFPSERAPMAYIDESRHPSGISADYLRLLEELGVPFELVPVSTLIDLDELLQRDQIDAYIGASVHLNDPPGTDRWLESKPVISIAQVIVMRSGHSPVIGMKDLEGRRIAVFNAHKVDKALAAKAPAARIIQADSAEDGLEMVHRGDVDAFVGNLAVVSALLRSHYAGELAIAAPAGVDDVTTLIVKREYAPLVDLFNRALAGMSEREHQSIRSTWLAVTYEYGVPWPTLLRTGIPIALVVLAAALVCASGYLRLRAEVVQRRAAEHRLSEVTANLPAVVYHCQRLEDGTLSFPYIVGDTRSLFGLTPEQAIEDEGILFQRVHPEDRQALRAAIDRSWATMTPLEIDFRAQVDGDWLWVRSHAHLQRSASGQLSWTGYWIDVTQAHAQAEALSQAKEAAERAASAKAQFLATMSHEIRTPMSAILGMLDRLQHTRLAPEQRHVLNAIGASADMLRQILDDILDYSKIEAGALALDVAAMDLRALIDNVLGMVTALAHGKGLVLRSHIAADVAGELIGDAVRVQQVLFNLLSNAIKFTESGAVTVRVEVLEHSAAAQRLRLSVTDTGIGIPADQQARLFQPFVQSQGTGSRHRGGTGLGLSICRRLVDLMGGELSMDSEVGRGTCVAALVTFRVISAGHQHAELANVPVGVAVKDAAVAAALIDHLRGLGMLVMDATTGMEGGLLWFADEASLETVSRALAIVLVSDRPEAEGQFSLSSNPLLSSDVVRVCQRALALADDESTTESAAVIRLCPVALGRRVLLAEDHPANQELMCWYLEQLGFSCDVVEDGVLALEALRERHYDALVTDCQMPRLDGYALTQEIRRREQGSTRRLPVIALTANAMAEESQRCREAGMDEYLTKPVRIERLRASLERCLVRAEAMPDNDAKLDIAALSHRYGSQAVVARMIDRFIEASRQDIARLDVALAACDASEIRKCLHRISGAAGLLGADALTVAAQHLMERIESDGMASHSRALAQFRSHLDAFVTHVASCIHSPDAELSPHSSR